MAGVDGHLRRGWAVTCRAGRRAVVAMDGNYDQCLVKDEKQHNSQDRLERKINN